jgi:hypothetical protein
MRGNVVKGRSPDLQASPGKARFPPNFGVKRPDRPKGDLRHEIRAILSGSIRGNLHKIWAKASKKASIEGENFRARVFLFVMEEKDGLPRRPSASN